MRIEKLKFDDIRYNPELCAFEAKVQIDEDGERYVYPVYKMAPLYADFAFVARGLTEKALQAHRHAPAREIRLHRAPVPEVARRPDLSLVETPVSHRDGGPLAA